MALVIENSILKLKIEKPGKAYNNSRFDWTGNISQVLFDNKYTFCTAESTRDFDIRRHGQGMFNEFGITKPIGYADCAVGDKFPKIGVGLLTKKSNNDYSFFQSFEIDPFDIQIEKAGDCIKFIVFPRDCRGYSAKLIKKIRLSGNSFTIHYELENTGVQKIQTNEYCHNFISINKSDIDEHYTLRVPCKINEPAAMVEAVNPEKAAILNTNSVNFAFTPERDFFFSPLTEFHSENGEWEISSDSLGVGMKETTGFIPEMMNLWGLKHVISPELFIKIDLDPGQVMQWQRKYEFFYL